jgi:hypothetical protein
MRRVRDERLAACQGCYFKCEQAQRAQMLEAEREASHAGSSSSSP